MISILRALNERDRPDAPKLFQQALECYLSAIHIFQKHAIPGAAQDLKDYRESLGALHRGLFANHSAGELAKSREDLERQVSAYTAKVIQQHAECESEVKQIMVLLTLATGTLTERSTQYSGEFRNFAAKLEQTAQGDDLRRIRVELSAQVDKLRSCAATFEEDHSNALKPLQQELKAFEERLQHAERLASTDPLTEIFNRREGEKRAQERIQSGRMFCLYVVDLNRFKWINDHYGHHCGDQVLKLVAKRLEEQIRPSDTICRWGGDEFLVILDCGLSDAMSRSVNIGAKVWGRYSVHVAGRRVDLDVTACCGVAGHQPGETMEQVFERADAMLYQIKDKSRGGRAGLRAG